MSLLASDPLGDNSAGVTRCANLSRLSPTATLRGRATRIGPEDVEWADAGGKTAVLPTRSLVVAEPVRPAMHSTLGGDGRSEMIHKPRHRQGARPGPVRARGTSPALPGVAVLLRSWPTTSRRWLRATTRLPGVAVRGSQCSGSPLWECRPVAAPGVTTGHRPCPHRSTPTNSPRSPSSTWSAARASCCRRWRPRTGPSSCGSGHPIERSAAGRPPASSSSLEPTWTRYWSSD